MANNDIREAMRISGVKQWELADKAGYSASWFSAKLRHELDQKEKERLFVLIQELAEGRSAK